MSATAWIAVAGLGVTIFIQTVGLAFWLGGISSRMRTLESRPSNDDCATQLAAMSATLTALEKNVSERFQGLEHTIRNLLVPKTTRSRSGG
ncbi:hypothetical protein [Brevundimonas diminuta]|uniref:hypothetical protein n=1 Tax=Brevundimonas diminuta TaxID=293 RepID=UPI0025A556F0|nr:hypothetical protein [Brevundimonas diminuta]MDM8352906.1 hypothetical protein [Brevundimonas diminuta]